MLTIGLPVYNGERFLGEAVDSLLAQTHRDFRLVIADNCSDDRTPEIARTYSEQDERVHYVRRERNIGASANFNRLVTDADTPYFKWAASDDLHAPTCVERCLELLADDSDAIGAYTRATRINAQSEIVAWEDYRLRSDSTLPHIRLNGMTARPHSCFSVFGVFRTDVLRRTGLIRTRSHGDRILLAELVLHGRLLEHPAYLFSRRLHEKSFSSGTRRDKQHRAHFWSGASAQPPTSAGRTETDDSSPPEASLAEVYEGLVRDAPLSPSERRRCEFVLRRRVMRNRYRELLFRPLRRTVVRVRDGLRQRRR